MFRSVFAGACALAVAGVSLAGPPAAATAPASAAPPDVRLETLDRLTRVAGAEIALIREEMGRPVDPRPLPRFVGVHPRDVDALAATLLVRANRLMFERTHELADDVRAGEWGRPGDALALLDAAAARLAVVKASLSVTETAEAMPADSVAADWSAIAQRLLAANRQLDQLLDERIASRDVFERITEAVGHAARLVTAVTAQSGLPDPPAYERRRRPADVCARLLTCLDLVRRVERSRIVRLEVPEGGFDRATPGDALDLAALVTARVASLHARTADVEPPLPAYTPGPRLPSHAYQRAGILELQLVELVRHREAMARRLAPIGDGDAG